jgi:hypothetical protein
MAESRPQKSEKVDPEELAEAEKKFMGTQNYRIKTNFRRPVLAALCAQRIQNLVTEGRTRADFATLLIEWVCFLLKEIKGAADNIYCHAAERSRAVGQ